MIFLKWYLIACAVALCIAYIRVWGAINDFRRRHPKAVFKRYGFLTTVFNFIKCCIFFVVPLINVITFIGFLVISDERIEEVIIQKCESI